jgi:hypothetical protein
VNVHVAVPALLMVAVAAFQIVLALTSDLTPWKGGGFGMFSTLDHGAFRGVDIVIEAPERSEALDVPPSLEELAARAASYPSDRALRRLAREVAARERRHQRPVTRVKVTVWRTEFSPKTLLATERALRSISVDVR